MKKGFSEICSRLNRAVAQHPTNCRQACELALSALYRIAAFAAVSTKMAAWADEEEWRIVALVPKNSSITRLRRCARDKCVNYLELAMRQEDRPLFLDEILIGPSQDAVEARHRLECLLKRAGYPHESATLPKITPSSVAWMGQSP